MENKEIYYLWRVRMPLMKGWITEHVYYTEEQAREVFQFEYSKISGSGIYEDGTEVENGE